MLHQAIREGGGRVLAASGAPPPAAAPQSAPSEPAPRRSWLRRAASEPLTHFVAIGLLIFFAAHAIEARSKRYVIDLSQGDVTRIANSYAQQYGAPPTPEQLRTMVGNFVREEIYLREGLALGLGRNDEIVRRRIAQKFEFLQQDNAVPREPTLQQLRAYYAAHAANFADAPRRGFEQLYFSADTAGDGPAWDRAAAAARILKAGGKAPIADQFPGPASIGALSADEVERLFGGDGFAKAVFAARPEEWSGPFRSGFGWHLVRVTQVSEGKPRTFKQAQGDVRRAWIEADRKARNDTASRDLLARYSVELPR